tara:strand:+ start:1040 stop:2014 length:975 start_codon:yes stop_codon:yes gene_type:complete
MSNNIQDNINKLEIEELSIDKKTRTRRHTGVGVLIITNYNNKPHFLLGREEYKSIKLNGDYMMSIYEEFGGGIQKRSLSLEENACFELQEETTNIFNITNPELLNSGINLYFDIPFMQKRMYRLYLIFIEDVENIIPYFNKNQKYLKTHINSYYKYECFLEMNNLELISIDEIQSQLHNRDNYICNSAEDTLYNMSVNCNFRGILRVKNDIYLSKRLVDFLNMEFNKNYIYQQPKNVTCKIENNKELNNNNQINNNNNNNQKNINLTGLEFCFKIFKEGFIDSNFKDQNKEKNKILKLGQPFLNKKDNCKLKFLIGTWSFKLYN